MVAPLGDIQYELATAGELAGSYDLTWGRFNVITRRVPGHHEYEGDPERDSADGYYGYFGAAAGDPAQGYYAYEIGDWHAIALNTGALAYTRRDDNALPTVIPSPAPRAASRSSGCARRSSRSPLRSASWPTGTIRATARPTPSAIRS